MFDNYGEFEEWIIIYWWVVLSAHLILFCKANGQNETVLAQNCLKNQQFDNVILRETLVWMIAASPVRKMKTSLTKYIKNSVQYYINYHIL